MISVLVVQFSNGASDEQLVPECDSVRGCCIDWVLPLVGVDT